MKKIFLLILSIALFSSCQNEEISGSSNFFQDDFEHYNKLSELILHNSNLWSFVQATKLGNSVTIDTLKSHSGSKSLKFTAKKSDDSEVSKSSIVKQNISFLKDETIRISAWYFIEGTNSLQWLFLMDLEEKINIGANPGMRLALVDDKLRVEYKFNEKDIIQTQGQEINFPRNRWVQILWEIKLSQNNSGLVRLWQDDKLIIDGKDKVTLPKDFLYFQQGTKGMYNSLEIGITANSKDNDLIMWVDDLKFEKIK